MITVTIWDTKDGDVKFVVHRIEDDGCTTHDETDQWKVSPLAVEAADGSLVAGFHIGKKIDPQDVLTDGK